jgi:EF hand
VIPIGDMAPVTRRVGHYVAAWYTLPRQGKSRLIGRWRFSVTAPKGTLGRSLSIAAEVEHLFSQASNGHDGVAGYDANGDGAIDRRNESTRIDATDLWDGERLFEAAGGTRSSITRARFDSWFASFDKNHDGKLALTQVNGRAGRRVRAGVKGGLG